MFELSEQLAFIHDGVHRTLRNDPRLMHFLHRVELLGFLELDLPDLPKAPLPDYVVELEAVLINR